MKTEQGIIDVPCGRCNYCLSNRRKEWSFRLQKELRSHSSAYFLTMTYDERHVPMYDDHQRRITLPVLDKKDVQDFMKRLRKAQGKYGIIKYYTVGEYGSKTMRPHYHSIMFGLDPKVIPKINKIWSKGNVDVGTVTDDSIDYVTKYVINRYDHEGYLVPPFALISKGIGLEHLNKNKELYKVQGTVKGNRGYRQKLPRYYKKKLDSNKYSDAIEAEKLKIKISRDEKREHERLVRLGHTHQGADRYAEERNQANHDRIRHDRKGDGTI